MRLIIVHYHYRPGGVRRVIELATPHLLRELGGGENSVVLVGGEANDENWNRSFRAAIAPAPVEFVLDAALGYFAGQARSGAEIAERIARTMGRLFPVGPARDVVIWAHNLSLARNVPLTRELLRIGSRHDVPVVLHHHDWWFDNRWPRWPEMRRSGVRTLRDAARLILGAGGRFRHAVINRADAALLGGPPATDLLWLPNPAAPVIRPRKERVDTARRWIAEQLGEDCPVWLLPCRLLRRKNIAEALLLTRWLRGNACLVTTGGITSDGEEAYGRTLAKAALRHGWRLRLGVLAGDEAGKPSVPELMAASEAVVLTSVVEGFGLPFVEAAAAGRPLIARGLPNVAPDLHRLGFRFPQLYPDVIIDPRLFDWVPERARQLAGFARWRRCLPRACRELAGCPPMLRGSARPRPVAFSRLTLEAQIEVLAHPAEKSWEMCAPLNSFLPAWRKRAASGGLVASGWPAGATRLLAGDAYARRFARLLHAAPANSGGTREDLAEAAQIRFLRDRLGADHLFPLLWDLPES